MTAALRIFLAIAVTMPTVMIAHATWSDESDFKGTSKTVVVAGIPNDLPCCVFSKSDPTNSLLRADLDCWEENSLDRECTWLGKSAGLLSDRLTSGLESTLQQLLIRLQV